MYAKRSTDAKNIPRKSAWIDEERRILYFLPMPGTVEYCDEEGPFWERVLRLMYQNYRIG